MGIKNLWSLNIDEALVADKLKQKLDKKKYEVFFPLNSQLKDIDLIILNLKRKKTLTLQIKGSRTYSPKKRETELFGEGSGAWFTMTKKSIYNPSNNVDFFIFVLHSFVNAEIKKKIEINYLVIPKKDLIKVTRKKKIRKGNKYHFFIWMDTKGKRSFEFNNPKYKTIPLSKYLDNFELLKR